MEKLLIGEILKPSGLRGEVKMRNYTDGFRSVKDLKEVYIDGTLYEVLKIRGDKDIYVFFKGIYDRDAAETLRGKEVYAEKSGIWCEEGRYFIADVTGCDIVFAGGEVFGRVIDIRSAGTDIYYVEEALSDDGPDLKKGRVAIVPWLKSFKAAFDIEKRKITVNKEAFLKEVVYED